MVRPLRIEYKNAWYHVMNRGLRREDIFFTRDDRNEFLALIEEIFEKYQIQTHAFCLMSNHYHLMVNTPLPNLSKAMRHLGGLYTQRFNRSHKTDGPFFRGRYKSKIVESEVYLTRLSRYIHLNPVAANMIQLPEEYEWSSYPAVIGLTHKPKWLFCDETLSYFGNKNDHNTVTSYRDFVNEGVDEETSKLMSQKISQPIIGSSQFIKSLAKKVDKIPALEVPDHKFLVNLLQPSLSTIRDIVQNYFKIDPDEVFKSGQKIGNLPRRVAIYLAGKHTTHSHHMIACFFGNTSRYGISRICQIIKKDLEFNSDLGEHIAAIERRLLNVDIH